MEEEFFAAIPDPDPSPDPAPGLSPSAAPGARTPAWAGEFGRAGGYEEDEDLASGAVMPEGILEAFSGPVRDRLRARVALIQGGQLAPVNYESAAAMARELDIPVQLAQALPGEAEMELKARELEAYPRLALWAARSSANSAHMAGDYEWIMDLARKAHAADARIWAAMDRPRPDPRPDPEEDDPGDLAGADLEARFLEEAEALGAGPHYAGVPDADIDAGDGSVIPEQAGLDLGWEAGGGSRVEAALAAYRGRVLAQARADGRKGGEYGPEIRGEAGLFAHNAAGALYNGLMDLPTGFAGAARSALEQLGIGGDAPARVVRWLERRRVETKAESPVWQWAIDLGRNLPQVGMTVGLGLINPLAGLGAMGLYVYGSSYNELRGRGVDPVNAAASAAANAGAQAILERTSLNRLLKLFSREKGFALRDVAGAALSEGWTEFLQKGPEYLSFLWAEAARGSRGLGERWENFLDAAANRANLAQALKEGLYEASLGAGSGLIVGGVRYLRPGAAREREQGAWLAENRDLVREYAAELQRASRGAEQRLQLARLFGTAAAGGGDAESRRQKIEAAMPESLATMYVSPGDLRRLLETHGEKALTALGVARAKAEEALERGCPMPVSTAHVLAHAEETGNDSANALRQEPDGPSAAEAREWDPAAVLARETESILANAPEADFAADTPYLERAEILKEEMGRRIGLAERTRRERARLVREMREAGLSGIEAGYLGLAHYAHAMALHRATGYDPQAYLASISWRKGGEAAPAEEAEPGHEPRYVPAGGERQRPVNPEVIRRGNVAIGEERRVITLFSSRNVATAPHEFGHVAVDTLLRVAASDGEYAVGHLASRLESMGGGLYAEMAADLEEALNSGPASPLGTRLGMLLQAWRSKAAHLRARAARAREESGLYGDPDTARKYRERAGAIRAEIASARREGAALKAAAALARSFRMSGGEGAGLPWENFARRMTRMDARVPGLAAEIRVLPLAGGVTSLSRRLAGLERDLLKRARQCGMAARRLADNREKLESALAPIEGGREGADAETLARHARVWAAAGRAASEALRHAEAMDRARADITALAAHAGLSGEETRAVMEGERGPLYQKLQEASATGFTRYLMEGKSPSRALAPAFARYRQWFARQYENNVRLLGAPVPAECRAVFDRLLADENEIAAYALLDRLRPMLADIADNARMSEEDRRRVSESLERLASAAFEDGARPAARGMEEWRKKRAARHYASLGRDPFWLVAETERLDMDQVIDILGGDDAARLARKRSGLLAADGADIDHVAAKHGDAWPNSAAMIHELFDRLVNGRETRRGLADSLAERDLEARQRQGFAARLGRVSDQAARVYEIMDVILREQSLRAGGMTDAARVKRLAAAQAVPRETIRGMAREMVAGDPVGALTFSRFRAMLESSLRDCASALGSGDALGAANAFTRVRMANELLAESRRAGADLATLRRLAGRLIRSGVRSRGEYDDRALEAMRRVLSLTGLYGKRSFFDANYAAMSLRELAAGLEEGSEGGYAPILPAWLLDQVHPRTNEPLGAGNPLNPQSLTSMELADVMNMLDYLRRRGRDLRAEARNSRQSRVLAYVRGAEERLKKLKPFRTRPMSGALGRAEDIFAKFVAHADYFDFQLRRADGLANPLGRGEPGPLELGPMRALHRATDRARGRKERLLASLAPHLDALADSMKKRMREGGRAIRGENGEPLRPPAIYAERYNCPHLEADQILAMALNCGSKSNMARLVAGFPDMSYDDLAEILGDAVAGQAFGAWEEIQGAKSPYARVDRGRPGVLTAADWRHVQGVWDVLASQWPDISAAYRREYGFAPQPIEIHALRVAGEDGPLWLRGGYYPVHYDSRLSAQVAGWTQEELLAHSGEAVFQQPDARKTFTMGRTRKAAGHPLLLSTGILLQHVSEVSTFIELAHDAMFMWDIIRHPDFKKAFGRVYGPHQYESLKNNLRFTLRPEPAPRLDAIYDLARLARKYLVPWGLGLNFKVAAIQQTALFQGMNDVGAPHVLSAMGFIARRPVEALRAIQAVSPYMRSRVHSVESDLLDMGDRLASPNQWAFEVAGRRITHETLVNICLAPITCSDMLASSAVWLGAFNKRLGALMGEEKARVWNREGRNARIRTAAPRAEAATESAAGRQFPPQETDFSPEDRGDVEARTRDAPELFAGIPAEIFQECAAFADSLVMNANPDYDAINRSAFLRGKGAGYAFNMFASAVLRIFARWRIMKESLRQETISKNAYRRYAAYEFWAPGVAMTLFFFLLGGYWKDDPGEWAKLAASNLLDQQLLRAPLIGSALKQGILEMTGLSSGFQSSLRGSVSTVFEQPLNTLIHLARGANGDKSMEEVARRLGWNTFELLSMAARVPLAPAARRAARGWEQYGQGAGTPLSVLAPRPEKPKKPQPEMYYNLAKKR